MNDFQAETTAAPVSPVTLGQRLAEAREARGLSLGELAMRLKFSPRQLQALEANAYHALPEPTIVRGMVRSYAKAVGLDAGPLVAELEQQLVADPFTVVVPVMHVPMRDNSKRNTRIFFALSLMLLIVCAAVVAEWYWRNHVAVAPVAPPQTATPVPAPLALSPSAVGQPGGNDTAQTLAPATADPAIAEQESTASAAPAADAGTPPVTDNKRIELRFDGNAWVEVKDATGNVLMAQLNPARTEAVLQGLPPFSLVVGNAAAVNIQYDGNSVALAPYTHNDVARLTLE
jgi:cytoskeleton protein RodZ